MGPLTREIEALVTQIVARDVTAGVELARSLGYKMPKDFTIGVRFIMDGRLTRIRMRLDDVTYDSLVELPALQGSRFVTIDRMWKVAWERIHADALTVAQAWLDKHPEAFMKGEDGSKALSLFDTLLADKELSARWHAAARERAAACTYVIERSNDG